MLVAITPSPSPAQTPADSGIADFTLENGLRVLVWTDDTTPVVSTELWYDVGTGDEAEGEEGFVHLFEHLLQGPTRELAAGEGRRLIREVGGETTASADFDRTASSTRVASPHLELALWLEAQRMGALRVDESVLNAARATVQAEWQALRSEQDPVRRLQAWSPVLHRTSADELHHHPLGLPGLVERWGLADVRRFGNRYYGPGNATLAVVGDADPETVRALVQRHFGGIGGGQESLPPRPELQLPLRNHLRAWAGDDVGTPAALLHAWTVPPADHPDIPALALLVELLQPDRDGLPLAGALASFGIDEPVSVELRTGVGPGVLTVLLPIRGDVTDAALRTVLADGLEVAMDERLTPDRVEAARGRLRARLIDAAATGLGRARLLQEGRRMYGNVAQWDALYRALPEVTPEDIADVVERYLVWENSATLFAPDPAGGEE